MLSFSSHIVLASAPTGENDGTSGSLTFSTGKAQGGLASSGSITINTGDARGGQAGGFSVELGEARENAIDPGSSIEFKTGYNPRTSSGAFRVQTADGGLFHSSGEISLRTGNTQEGPSGAIILETGDGEIGASGECS